MIVRLQGILLEKNAPFLVIDVQGIGYEVEISARTLEEAPAVGETIIVHTHLIVREDAHLLYGFFDGSERALFRRLIKVSGVGPKVALSILGTLTPEKFILCLIQNDIKTLVNIPGVGKKMAERLIIETRDLQTGENALLSKGVSLTHCSSDASPLPLEESLQALLSLGYKPAEAQRAVIEAAQLFDTSEAIIRHALKQMSGGIL